ncbi:hypothetical protein F5Y01DRAFT_286860 [Xylaria sp. FL0043]|nr:hypothetical protein F5Y01DRAFT_286860 [Xylaria sp. FL0043]
MDATATATEQPSPMRQSCDRCHKQKLRCTREASTNSGACDKCIRKRAQCIYSFALPKGRPSRYRASSVQIEAPLSNPHQPGPSQPVPVSSIPRPDQQDAASPSRSPSPNQSPKLVSRGEVPTIGDNGGTEEDEAAAPLTNVPPLDLSDPILAAQDSYTGNWDWNGATSLTHHGLDWDYSVHTAAYDDASALGIAAFAALLNQPMMGDRAVDGLQQALTSSSSQPLPVGTAPRMDNGSLVESDTALGLPHMKFDPDLFISELSKLSARLSTLRRSCYNVVAALEGPTSACPGLQQPLLHEVNFKVACNWLAQGPDNMDSPPSAPTLDAQTTASQSKEVGLLLHEVYTASYLLLEILRSLQANLSFLSPAESNSTPSATSSESSYFQIHAGQVSPSLSVLPSLSAPFRQGLVTSDRNSPNEGNDVIHHLVMACHTMLLTIYIALLLILERETDFSIRTNTLVLGDIRLVSVVQTCSYLIKRLHQSMDSYLPLQPASHSLSAPNSREAMRDLQKQIKDLLERIEGRLCI